MDINNEQRLKLEDSMQDAVFKMSEGNPGAINVLMPLIMSKEDFHLVLNLDSIGLYGTNIYKLANDCCNGDMDKFKSVLSAWNKSKVTRSTILQNVVNNGLHGKPVEEWLPIGIIKG
jgi:hypothetical protein